MTATVLAPAARMESARLSSFAVRDFRNLQRVELEPAAEGMVIVGENGQGKTNVLESIYYLMLLRSARGARDVDLVRFGADGFHLSAQVASDRARAIGVGFERAGRKKRVRVDDAIPERMSDALGALPCVMFAPTDVELVAGAPSARRRYLDILLALTSRGYLNALQRYRAALSHRNAALRAAARTGAAHAHDARIAVWEEPLAEHGAVLWHARVQWVRSVSERFSKLAEAIGEQAPVSMRYASALGEEANGRQALARALESQRLHDIRRGLTHAGPHRDDLGLTIELEGGPRDLRTFGSAGQQRSAAIAMRMLEAETFRERRGLRPLFLLDDPFAELDVRRAGRIVELLETEGLGQTLLVVPRESDIPRGLGELARLRIRGGVLEPWRAGTP